MVLETLRFFLPNGSLGSIVFADNRAPILLRAAAVIYLQVLTVVKLSNQEYQMFKHLSKLFDHKELPVFISEYNRLKHDGQEKEALVLRARIADILTDSHTSSTIGV